MASSKKKKKKGKGRAGNSVALSIPVVLAGAILTVVAILALLWVRSPEQVDSGRQVLLLDELEVEVESALLRGGFSLEQIDVRHEPDLLAYDIRGFLPDEVFVDRLQQRLQNRFGLISHDLRSETYEVLIYRSGALVCLLQFERPEVAIEPPPKEVGKPMVVIIMDDLGRSLERAREVVDLDLPVTFSILPGEVLATEAALLAARSGHEVMIHVPMEPQSYPETNPGSDALLLGQSEAEIMKRVRGFFKKVPYAVGANNHMGSRFTEYRDGMEPVLKVMRERGMYFIDSRTTAQSVVIPLAEDIGVPSTIRDVFLDNDAEVEAISAQIRTLVRLAERQGHAVGICHPYVETIEALRREKRLLRGGTVKMVFASKLISS